MSQTPLVVAPQKPPEPWNFSSTDSNFSGQFLVQQLRELEAWLTEHATLISAGLGLFGVVLVATTWFEFQTALQHISTSPAENSAPSELQITPSKSTDIATTSATFRAHIAGAVRKPGVYELVNPSVVQDLVAAAGGLSSLVWQDYLDEYINLASPLLPNQKVWIPSLAQRELLEVTTVALPLQTELDDSSPVASDSGLFSINTASVAELDTLAGIGQKRAEDIVANRPYAAIEELTSKAAVPASIVSKLINQLKL